jgi:hypothetical protein
MPACLQTFPLLEVDRRCRVGAGPSQFDPLQTLLVGVSVL